MAYEIVVLNGRKFVKIYPRYKTVKGVRIYPSDGKKCFIMYIPIEKFDASRYTG